MDSLQDEMKLVDEARSRCGCRTAGRAGHDLDRVPQ